MAICKKYPWALELKFLLPCSEWIVDPTKFKIFKKENLEEAKEWFEQMGFKFKESWEFRYPNTRTKALDSYKHVFSKSSLDYIGHQFHNDFINFGYEK